MTSSVASRSLVDCEPRYRETVIRMLRSQAWLRQGLICLGRHYSDGNKYAVSVGLKKRDSAEGIKDYVRDILPADIDWPLD